MPASWCRALHAATIILMSTAVIGLISAATPTPAGPAIREIVWNNTAFGGVALTNGTVAALAGPSSVGCDQSAEFIGTLTAPPEATEPLAFSAEVDAAATTLRVWVADYLVLDGGTTGGGGGGGGGGGDTSQTAKLWYSAARGTATFCASTSCDLTQKASGYAVLSANEGGVPNSGAAGTVPLYFSWSPRNRDNWVTTSSACPGQSYTSCGNRNGLLFSAVAPNRTAVVAYSNADGTHHMAAATDKMKRWAAAHGYAAVGTLGFLDAPGGGPSPPAPSRRWRTLASNI